MKNECIDCPCIVKYFRTLNKCQAEELGNNHVVVRFKKGYPIIKQGTFSTNVLFLRKGLVKIHITGPYREQIVRLIKRPSYLGLPTTIGDKINQYSITALLDCEVCFIDLNIFNRMLEQNKDFSNYILLELCRSEVESFRHCANRTQKQLRGNLADVLIDFSENIFESNKFLLPLSQSEIGNLVDTTRESVCRVLSEFMSDGIIRMEGKKIEILNTRSLKMISQNG
ncbi:MAG TPA: Crp/Fnr family transcriptional regulator [Bacteroidales bacterium]|jgi:CRP/FNR family transcriptional regulator|nr:Crp/Fnr family transcriptional regulator [Bacteroidales bacterium]MDI9574274.1 Crp/Fnr family transcriptional regulator [Bacteroidota bacterium]OQC59706.1 MAG: Transcriptional activator protein Anr [Bacteroidetes bacterium ADurb.Bin012]MBP9512415.1 Crp/Fnr family transcriptional regulator [Bacteroidales bacterium]MBP9589104.1 Crp/Fnr family transcriptional regulator [Bacteroidales bacterium]